MHNRNAFDKRLTLLRLELIAGHRSNYAEKDRAVVWASVSEPSVTARMNALSVGEEISYSAVMWRGEFRDFTHAELDGVRYRITQTGGTDNPLKIRLLLARG